MAIVSHTKVPGIDLPNPGNGKIVRRRLNVKMQWHRRDCLDSAEEGFSFMHESVLGCQEFAEIKDF